MLSFILYFREKEKPTVLLIYLEELVGYLWYIECVF